MRRRSEMASTNSFKFSICSNFLFDSVTQWEEVVIYFFTKLRGAIQFVGCYADITLLRYDLAFVDNIKYRIACLLASKNKFFVHGGAHATSYTSSLFEGKCCTPRPILRSIRPTPRPSIIPNIRILPSQKMYPWGRFEAKCIKWIVKLRHMLCRAMTTHISGNAQALIRMSHKCDWLHTLSNTLSHTQPRAYS